MKYACLQQRFGVKMNTDILKNIHIYTVYTVYIYIYILK